MGTRRVLYSDLLLFLYIFERDERTDDEHDPDELFVDGPFKIHKSRADDVSRASDPDSGDGTGEPNNSE